MPSFNHWQSLVLSKNASLKDAIALLNSSDIKFVMLVDEVNSLYGTITDGDVRRALLDGFTLNSVAGDIANKTPVVLTSNYARDQAVKIMLEKGLSHMPILDEGKLIGLCAYKDLDADNIESNVPMVIMAGGRGIRMGSHTSHCPKPMLKVSGKPILEHLIDRAKKSGIKNFYISLNYLGEVIEDYFGNGDCFGVRINYIRESEPLGTAGALSYLRDCIEGDFLLTNGDVITDVNYARLYDFYQRHSTSLTMAVRTFEMQNPFGVVRSDGILVREIVEKPVVKSLVNAGIYVLNSDVLNFIVLKNLVNTYLDMPDLINMIVEDGYKVSAFPIHELWMDIGRPDDLQLAQTRI